MSTKGFVPHHLRFFIRRAVLLLFLLIFGRFAQTVNGQGINAGIDRGRVHVNDLLWDLESLARVPAFSWVKSDSIVASLLYSSVDVNGKPTRVFAYYSDPDRIKGRAASG